MAIKKTVKKTPIKKMQIGGAAKKAIQAVSVKKPVKKEPKGFYIGGPESPSKGDLYNDANKRARSKYYTPDNIRENKKFAKISDMAISADIGYNTERMAREAMKANNMGENGLPIRSKSKAKPKAKTGGSMKRKSC